MEHRAVGSCIGSVSIASGYVDNLPNPEFNSYAVTNEGFSAAALLLSTYLVARFVLHRQVVMTLTILILSASPVFLVVWQIQIQLLVDYHL